ncbi:testis-specific gene A8 protein-like [Xyrichtys novacula]|uniref:Testis-specific gene A8 protein-like n=1 Tax=Xyrichtys novacula TaxID=13765 RepID=A0AAV1F0C5_XYRNO|nr:testis-specific gene A8 protein-like [Xyrichtys novacula]
MTIQNESEKPPIAATGAAAVVMLTVKTGFNRMLAPQQLAGFTDSRPSRDRRLVSRQQLVRLTAGRSRSQLQRQQSASRKILRERRGERTDEEEEERTVGREVVGG